MAKNILSFLLTENPTMQSSKTTLTTRTQQKCQSDFLGKLGYLFYFFSFKDIEKTQHTGN